MQPKTMPTDGDIRHRAYHLWDSRGRPNGYQEELWLQAERELHAETTGQSVLPDGDYVTSGSGSDCSH
jgi:hypothetical protein